MQLRNPRISKKKREYYSRIYNLKDNEKLVQLQIDKLQECDKYFGYCSDDFDTYFHFSLYLYDSITTTLLASSHSTSPIIISPSTSPIHASFTEDSMYSSSDYDCNITELNFNFIIRPCNEKARPNLLKFLHLQNLKMKF
ncbi:hypothetical protein GLOIN_2v1772564 [Rhizophagus clarus]|uniref:Uncharacterized protein n=1 Tax=Rhizophagus clarus TaxID=94130 RepID=A0A8H3M7F8_9GLOM|nr:hypothetical protein GLOIN_2v1772564 [Rhizophagus clarus]